jgi:hypothetical protein
MLCSAGCVEGLSANFVLTEFSEGRFAGWRVERVQ